MQIILNFLQNTYVSAAVTLFLVLYAGLAAPKLPDFVAGLFDNPLFRLFVLFLIAYTSARNAQIALMIAVAFTLTMNVLSEQRIAESFMAGVDSYEYDEE